jgi:hypothetical protein
MQNTLQSFTIYEDQQETATVSVGTPTQENRHSHYSIQNKENINSITGYATTLRRPVWDEKSRPPLADITGVGISQYVLKLTILQKRERLLVRKPKKSENKSPLSASKLR